MGVNSQSLIWKKLTSVFGQSVFYFITSIYGHGEVRNKDPEGWKRESNSFHSETTLHKYIISFSVWLYPNICYNVLLLLLLLA